MVNTLVARAENFGWDRTEKGLMPLRLKRSLFLAVVGTAAWLEGCFLAPYGFNRGIGALVFTIVLAVGWMRTYW